MCFRTQLFLLLLSASRSDWDVPHVPSPCPLHLGVQKVPLSLPSLSASCILGMPIAALSDQLPVSILWLLPAQFCDCKKRLCRQSAAGSYRALCTREQSVARIHHSAVQDGTMGIKNIWTAPRQRILHIMAICFFSFFFLLNWVCQ